MDIASETRCKTISCTSVLIATEFYERNLLEHLEHNAHEINERDRVDLLKQINEGLLALHEAGVIHGDVTAENVSVHFNKKRGRNIVYKLGGFGFSRMDPGNDEVKSEDMRHLGLLFHTLFKGRSTPVQQQKKVAHFPHDEDQDGKLDNILAGLLHWNPLVRTSARNLKEQLSALSPA